MADLSHGEFERMQQEAKSRVFEMQKRSRFITEEFNADPLAKKIPAAKTGNKNEEQQKTERRDGSNKKEAVKQHEADNSKGKDDRSETLFLLLLSELLKESNKDVADFILLLLLL